MVRNLFVLTVASMGVLASAQVQISTDGRPSRIAAPKAGLNARDKVSIKESAAANIFEIRTSEIALKRGFNMWTKMFAKDMITDHSASFEELKLVAKKKGMMVSKTLPPMQAAIVRKLETCPRGQFDAMYRMVQMNGHKMTADMMAKGIKYGQDSDVKGYLTKTLPVVKAHLKMIEMKKTMSSV